MPKKGNPAGPLETDPQTQATPSVWREVWEFFASMKVGLVLLLILAVATALGTVIPQKGSPEMYIRIYGETLTRLFGALGVFDLYHSWWYVGLLAILSLNLIVCSLNRWKGLVRETRIPGEPLGEESFQRLKVRQTVKVKGEEGEIWAKVEDLLRRRGYRTARLGDGSAAMLYADKGRYGVFGSLVTHLSIVLILLGGLYGAIKGFNDYVQVIEGETFTVPRHNFQVRVEDFRVDYRSDFRPKQYYSRLTILENGREAKTQEIFVNGPLVYRGVKFYQSSYGWAVEMTAKPLRAGVPTQTVIRSGAYYQVPGTPWLVRVHTFIPDYDPSFSTMNHNFASKTPLPNNPRVVYVLYQNGVPVNYGLAAMNEPIKTPDYEFTFTGYKEFTGLQVRQDPGLPLVYAGSILMVVGLFMSFYISPRRIWVRIKPQGKEAVVTLGGIGRKNSLGFAAEVEEMARELEG